LSKNQINNITVINSKNDNYFNDISNLISTFSYEGIKLFQDMKIKAIKTNYKDDRIFKKNYNLIGKPNNFSESNIIRKFKARF